MKARTLVKTVLVGVALAVLVFAAAGAGLQRAITVEAEGEVLSYSDDLYWDEGQFDQEYREFSAGKAKYMNDLVQSLSKEWREGAYYEVETKNWAISFRSEYELEGEATYLARILCDVQGPEIGTTGSPYYAFEWLLKPIFGAGPDLYAFEYSPDGKSLIYEGEIEYSPITITLIFPKPISHCHYHVWYRE
jgi:hypothetical protein